MTNKEKYKDKIVEMAVNGKALAVEKHTLEPKPCHTMDCKRCICNDQNSCVAPIKKWAEQEYNPCIDWTKVKRDTPILVSSNNIGWYHRYFANYKHGEVYAYADGRTSFSRENTKLIAWGYAKLAEVKNDG